MTLKRQKKSGDKQPSLWTRPFVMLMLQNLMFWIAINMLTTALPGYLLAIGGSPSLMGVQIGIFSYAALLFRPAGGILLDFWDRRLVLLAGLILTTAMASLYLLRPSVCGLMVLRFFQGLGFSAYTMAASTISADVVPARRMAEGLGIFALANTISLAIGPPFCLSLAKQGYVLLFTVILILLVISLSLTVFIENSKVSRFAGRWTGLDDPRSAEPDRRFASVRRLPGRLVRGMIEKTAFRPSLVAFFMMAACGSVLPFLPLYGQERGFPDIGLFFTVYVAALFAARFLTGRLADERGSNFIFIPSMLLAIVSTLILAFARSEITLFLAAAFYCAGTGMAFPALNAILIRLAPPDKLGAANATFFAIIDIAVGTVSIAMGMISEKAGFTTFFVVATIFFGVSLGCYLIFLCPSERENHEQARIHYYESHESTADILDPD
jgi:MFS family permease